MNDEHDNPLGSEARAVLEAARHVDDPRETDRARVGRALLARVAAGGAVGAGATLWGARAAAMPAFTFKVVLLPALLVVAGGLMGAAVVLGTRTPAPPAPVVAAAPIAVAAPTTEVAPVGARLPAVAPSPAPEPPTPPRVRGVPTHQLARETALLAEVTVALRNGDAPRGLRLLDAYQRRYPGGILREEMQGARIIARCQMAAPGVGDLRYQARAVAGAYLRRYPASPLAPRIRAACEAGER